MASDLSSRTELLFKTAMGLPENERRTYLHRECGSDKPLLEELEALLTASAGADDYFAELAERFGLASVFRGDIELPEQDQIGAFKLLRLIGRGGMGAVYLAERADKQYEQRVALKILPFGVGGKDARDRFFAERQILARLVHPNIARLLDGGITEQGTPYFVMDFVEGEPLDVYCDTHRLGLSARLALFCDVCEAVQFAHRNLIVHRDLKPANVLVEKPGNVKLLDFGIAKALAAEPDNALMTRTGVLPMSSLYASPEMLRRETITTSSDVYALGVILYELLVGRHPYGLSNDASGPELWHSICELDPIAPGKAALQDNAAEARANSRGMTPKRLAQSLAGDLDTIVAKAMQKDPEQRYGSVEQLVADIRRHLNGLPVLAKPPTAMYRLQKFVARRKGLVAAGIAALVFVGATLYQSNRATEEAERANREAEVAREVSDFLVSVFEVAGPARSRGEAITARELLDNGAEQLAGDAVADPEVAARLKSTIAHVYTQLAAYKEAEALFEDALRLQRLHLGDEHTETLQTLTRIGLMYQDLGRFDEAEEMLAETFTAQQRILGKDHADALATMRNLAIVHAQQGDYAGAIELGVTLVDSCRRAFGAADPRTLRNSGTLAVFHKLAGDWNLAESLYQEVLMAVQSQSDGNDPMEFSVMQNLADLYSDQSRYDEAEPLYEQAMAGMRRVYGDDHPNVTRITVNFANMNLGIGDYEKAESLYSEALDVQRATLGEHHFETLNGKMKLGELYTKQGRFDDAERILIDALEGHRESLGPVHRKTAAVLARLAEVYRAMGNDDQALAFAEERLKTWHALATADDASIQDRLSYGWNLTTIEPKSLRDPQRALPLLIEANTATNYAESRYVWALAHAYKGVGNVEMAIETTRNAIALLPDGAADNRAEFEAFLAELENSVASANQSR